MMLSDICLSDVCLSVHRA